MVLLKYIGMHFTCEIRDKYAGVEFGIWAHGQLVDILLSSEHARQYT